MEEEQERFLYHQGAALLEELGLKQYEISNFAYPGWECRHNLNYWRNGEYIGCGCSAHSYYQSLRRGNVMDMIQYIERIQSGMPAAEFQEETDTQTEVFETLMLGFRLNEGINKEAFHSRFGFSLSERYRKTIEELKGQGLLTEDTQALRPTSLGFDLQNRIALAFLD